MNKSKKGEQSRNEDLVIRFANVNGTGSASANGLVAKALFRMGFMVGPKNMFPSNIQGFPTWYEIRVSSKGYTGRKGGVHLMVAMNPESFVRDIAAVDPGGWVIFDESRFGANHEMRSDIHYLPVPLTKISLDFPAGAARTLLKNIIYVGVLVALVPLDEKVVRQLLSELYSNKPKLLDANYAALELGMQFAREKIQVPHLLPVLADVRGKRSSEAILIDGNEAAALGALHAGATVCAWYPITPSTSVVEHFGRLCHRFRIESESGHKRYGIMQAEDEIAAIGMVLGAAWNGARAFTATSGPGISLMSEFLGYAYYAEIPAVLFNIQRVGPSTGMPTRTQQADLIACAYASHGDTKHPMLFPGSVLECFRFALVAFDLADVLQTPVFFMSELELGMNEYVSQALSAPEGYQPNRGKVLGRDQLDELVGAYQRYTSTEDDGIAPRTLPGVHPTKGAFLTRGSGHDKFGRYTEDGELYQENMDRLALKWRQAKKIMPEPESLRSDPNAKIGLVFVGVIQEPLGEALDLCRNEGVIVDALRVRSFPFHAAVTDFCQTYEKIVVLDQNRDSQLRQLLIAEEGLSPDQLLSLRHYNGLPATAEELKSGLLNLLGGIQ